MGANAEDWGNDGREEWEGDGNLGRRKESWGSASKRSREELFAGEGEEETSPLLR